jgi:hypothetical protein
MVITDIWQDRHRSVQNSHTLRMGRDWPVKPVDQIVEIFRAKGVGGATELENRLATHTP